MSYVSLAMRFTWGRAVIPEPRPVNLMSPMLTPPPPFHVALPHRWLNGEVAKSPTEVKGQTCRPERSSARFVCHLSNSAEAGKRPPRREDGWEVASADRQREEVNSGEREGEMYGRPHCLRQSEWWGRGYFSEWAKLERLPVWPFQNPSYSLWWSESKSRNYSRFQWNIPLNGATISCWDEFAKKPSFNHSLRRSCMVKMGHFFPSTNVLSTVNGQPHPFFCTRAGDKDI